ncbi:MAG: hypothetical protein ABEJ23_01520 [Haloarculaceae archaeon]
MNTTTSRIAVVAVLLALIAGALVVVTGGAGLFSHDGRGFEESGLARFQTLDPICADQTYNASTGSRPVPGGRRISINDTVPVAHRNATLDASFDQVGPHRYHLDVRRVSRGPAAGCDREVPFNATLNVTHPSEYTIILTYDGHLAEVQWSEPNAAGVSRRVSAPAPANRTERESDGAGSGAANAG